MTKKNRTKLLKKQSAYLENDGGKNIKNHSGTIFLHGIIWTELTEEQFEKEWGYGWIFFGYEVNEKTINYIVKYVTKRRRQPRIQRKDIHFKRDWKRLYKQELT